jgi:hypothetical protein
MRPLVIKIPHPLSRVDLDGMVEISQGLLIGFEFPICSASPKIEMRMVGSQFEYVVELIKSLLVFSEKVIHCAQRILDLTGMGMQFEGTLMPRKGLLVFSEMYIFPPVGCIGSCEQFWRRCVLH